VPIRRPPKLTAGLRQLASADPSWRMALREKDALGGSASEIAALVLCFKEVAQIAEPRRQIGGSIPSIWS